MARRTKEQKPQLDTSVPVTPENMLDHPATPSDMLHQHVRNVIAKPLDDRTIEEEQGMKTAAEHPNIQGQALADMFDHFSRSDERDRYDVLEAVLKNPKLPADRAEKYLRDTASKIDWDTKDKHTAAANHPGVDPALLEQLVTDQVNNPELEETHRYESLKPEFYHKLLQERPIPEPEEGQVTDAQKATNRKVKKIDELVSHNLGRTPHHTPETLDQAIAAFSNQLPEGMGASKASRVLSDLVRHQKNLTPHQIDKIVSTKFESDEYGINDHRSAAMSHANTDPKLLARYANSSDPDDQEMQEIALANPNLPEETKKAIISSDLSTRADKLKMSGLLQNPALTPEDLRDIYQKDTSAISHENAPQDILEDFADKKKTADGARQLLRKDKLPPSVLSKIVTTNKNPSVVEEALEHPSADISVVQAAMKRKAPWAQQAAMRHPLVAKQYLMDGLASGKITPHDFLFDSKNRKALSDGGEVPPAAIEHIDKMYAGTDKPDLSDDTEAMDVKYWLATNDQVPKEVQARNAKELSQYFLDSTKNGETNANLGNHVLNLAEKHGNADAIEAMLQRPALWSNASFEKETYPSSFLDKIADRLPTDEQHASYSSSIKKDIAKNPNVGLDTFRKITHDPKFLSDSYAVSSSGCSWRRQGEEHNTIFDKRWAELSPEDRESEFKQLEAIGTPEAKQAILNSKSAPKEMWKQAFLSATPEEVHDWIQKNHLSDFADDNVLGDVLNLRVTGVNPRYSMVDNEPVMQALESLNPEKPEHRKMLEDFIQNIHNLSEIKSIPRKEIADHVPDKMLEGARGAELVNKALNTDVTLGTELAGRRALNSFPESHSNEEKDAAGSAVLRDLDEQFKQASAVDPDMYRAAWEGMMFSSHRNSSFALNALREIGQDAYGKPNGKLDFLADLPGDGANDFAARKKALELNLIGPEKAAALSDEDPQAFAETMSSLDGPVKHERLSSFVDRQLAKPQADDDAIEAIVRSTNPEALTGHERVGRGGRRQKGASETQVARAHDLVGRVTDMALRHSTDADSQITRLGRNIATGPSGGLTEVAKKQIVKTIIDRVKGSALPDKDKNGILISFFDGMAAEGSQDMVPGRMRTEIVKKSIANGDISALVKVLKSGDAPRGIWTTVANTLKAPEALSNDDLIQLSSLTKLPDTSAAAKVKLMNVMTDRYMADPAGEDADDLQRSISSMVIRNVTSNDQTSAEAAFSTGMKMTTSTGDLNAQERALSAMMPGFSNENISVYHKMAAFRNLPEYIHASVVSNSDPLPDDLVNLPGMIEVAHDGWKLALIARSAKNMNQETAKVVANRLVEAKADGMDQYARNQFVLGSITSNLAPEDAADPIDVIKVARMLTHPAMQKSMLQSLSEHSSAQPKHYMIMPMILDNIESGLSSPDMTYGDWSDHINSLTHSAKALSLSLSYGHSPQGVKVKHSYLLGRALDLVTQHIDSGITKFGMPPPKNAINDVRHSLIETFNTVNEVRRSGFDHTEEVSKKYLGLLSKAKEIAAKVPDPESFHLGNLDIGSWTKYATLSPEGWKNAMEMHPEIAYDLNMETIPDYVMDAINYKSMIKNRFRETKDLFYQWVGKMDAAGRTKHVRGILDAMHDTLNSEDVFDDVSSPDRVKPSRETKLQSYIDVAKQAVAYAPGAFDTEYLKKIGSALIPNGMSDVWSKAIGSGAGGKDFADYYWSQTMKSNMTPDAAEKFAESPSITDTIADGLVDLIGKHENPTDTLDLIKAMLKNTSISEKPFRRLMGAAMESLKGLQRYERRGIVKELMQHPKIDRDTYFKLYEETKEEYPSGFTPGEPFSPAFTNAKFGGDLFRAQPIELPDQFHGDINPDNLVTKAEHSVAKDRLNQALAAIPPQGITWADFKKQQPKMQNWPEIKQMFISKNNKPVLPEDVSREMSQHDGYDFHVTYTKWTGAQRHSKAIDMVMQLNTYSAMEKKLSEDPKRWAFFQFVQKSANHVAGDNMGGHPVTPHCASWVRVDTSAGKKGWIIEEFQSDFGARLHQEVDSLVEKAEQTDFKIDDYSFTPDEMHKYTNEIADIIGGWHKASLKAVEELARRNGVSDLYLHGAGIRATLSGMRKSKDLPVWLQTMYDKVPRSENWEAVDYSDYPNKGGTGSDAKKEGYPTKCWRKPLKP